MKPLRIALVAEDYYPQLGGVPEHVHNLARELDSLGHSTTVVTSNMRGPVAEQHSDVRRLGTSLVVYANGGVARITVGWRLTAGLEALFRAERFDIVHVHGGLAPVFGLLAPRAAWRAGIPVVATFHSWFPRSIGYTVFRRTLQRMLDRHAATIVVSSAAQQALSRYFKAPWEVIPNGVDTTFFRPTNGNGSNGHSHAHGNGHAHRNGNGHAKSVEHGSSKRSPQLLWLGRIEPRNGLGTVLSALPRILERHPSTELTVVGDGPWRSRMERVARPLGEAVRFAGYANGDRPDYYRSADVYVCSTTRASFGVTLLEAMACGTPMVVSDLPAFRDVAGHAVFAPLSDAKAWAQAVTRLIDDGDQRKQMTQAGRTIAERYAWPLVTQRVLDVYRRVLG